MPYRNYRYSRNMYMRNQPYRSCCTQKPAMAGTAGMVPMRSVMRDCYARNMSLAEAYVLPQIYQEMFSPAQALEKGTAFPGLYMPYDPCAAQGW